MLAPALGPVLGGLLLDHLSWRWMFLINVPVCVVALILAVRLLPAGDPEREAAAGLDGRGLALLSPGLAAVVYGLARLAEGGSPVWLLAGAALLVAFGVHALRRRERALLDLRLFQDRAFATSVGVLAGYSVAAFGALILIPLYAQTVRGRDTLDAGLLVAPLGAGAIVTMSLAGRISARSGTRWPSVAGLGLVLAGLSAYTRVDASTGWPALAVATFVLGLGHGLVTPLAMAGAYRDLLRAAIPGATTAASILVRVGSALGAALLAIVLQYLSRHTTDAATAFAGSFRWAFGVAAATLLTALISAR